MAKKSSNEITETLLEAMDTVIAARISSLPYDKTIVCTIIDDSQSGIGKYKVSADNGVNIFNAYADPDIVYYKDTQVYVKILNNETGVSRIITGKYIQKLNSSTSQKTANGNFYLTADLEENKFLYRDLNIRCDSNFNEGIPISIEPSVYGYNGVKITLSYKKEKLDFKHNARLKVKICLIGVSSMGENVASETDEKIVYETDGEDYLPVNNLLNDTTDNLIVTNSLYLSFDNQNLNITKIKIFPIFENININSTELNEYSFNITSVNAEFGYWIKKLGLFNDQLFILPLLSLDNNNNIKIVSQYYNDSNRTGQMFTYRYIQINEENKAKEMDIFDTVDMDKIYWGYYDSSFEKIYNEGEERPEWAIGTNIFWHPLAFEANIATINDLLNTSIEKIKITLIFSYKNVSALLKAQDFYLYNDSYVSKSGSVLKGIQATFDDGTNGNYFIYDKDGLLLNNLDASKERKIILEYVNSANSNDVLKDKDEFVLDDNLNQNSMIEFIELKRDISETEKKQWICRYKIKNVYNQNYNNNTFKFSLIHNGTRYSLEKELMFGYSGSEENKYNIRVNLIKENIVVDKILSGEISDYKLQIIVYNYNNKRINGNEGNEIPLSNSNDINTNDWTINFISDEENHIRMIKIIEKNIKAVIYYPLAYSYGGDNYHYNGPTIITYDDKGNIKFNKENCSLSNDNKDNNDNISWQIKGEENENSPKPSKNYFILSQEDGQFAPNKICDLSNEGYKYFILIAKNNDIPVWEQTIIFQKNLNITSTQIDSSNQYKINDNESITNITTGRIKTTTDGIDGLFIGTVSTNDTNEEFGLFNYNKANQILKATDDGSLKIGHSDNSFNGDNSIINNNYHILNGEWTVTNATKLVAQNNLNGISVNSDGLHILQFNNGVPITSNANCGNNNQFIYLENGSLKATSNNIGANNQPVYLKDGALTAFNSNIGHSKRPVYINNSGTITQVDNITINGNSCSYGDALTKIVTAINKLAAKHTDIDVWV